MEEADRHVWNIRGDVLDVIAERNRVAVVSGKKTLVGVSLGHERNVISSAAGHDIAKLDVELQTIVLYVRISLGVTTSCSKSAANSHIELGHVLSDATGRALSLSQFNSGSSAPNDKAHIIW